MIQIEHDQARNGQPILRAVDPDGRKVLLHSRYDPEREAQQWCDQLECKERDVILLYGLGLGYHVKPLLSRQNRPIFAVEPNSEVIDISRKLNPSFFDGGDVQVVTDWEEFKSASSQRQRNNFSVISGSVVGQDPPLLALGCRKQWPVSRSL